MGETNADACIRNVCEQLAKENNPRKIHKLAGELRSAVDTEQDEARLRLRYIAQRYRDRVRGMAGMQSASERASQVRALIAFLGFGSGMGGGGRQTQN